MKEITIETQLQRVYEVKDNYVSFQHHMFDCSSVMCVTEPEYTYAYGAGRYIFKVYLSNGQVIISFHQTVEEAKVKRIDFLLEIKWIRLKK